MKSIPPNTRQLIKAYLEVFIENLVQETKERKFLGPPSPEVYLSQRSSKAELKPFHVAMIPIELMRITAFERSFSTRLGSTFEECARLIALEHHADAKRGYRLQGEVSLSALNEIERQTSLFEHMAKAHQERPSLEDMIQSVMEAQRNDDLASLGVITDLYVRRHDGTEFYFELKSPVPNKGQCIEVTQRILRVHLLTQQFRPRVGAYFAMAYNPYGANRKDYRWPYAIHYMPFQQSVVIGQEFWTLIGGETAYEELLSIYQEVGQEKTKFILDALAFGF
jgi:hypothetical protein